MKVHRIATLIAVLPVVFSLATAPAFAQRMSGGGARSHGGGNGGGHNGGGGGARSNGGGGGTHNGGGGGSRGHHGGGQKSAVVNPVFVNPFVVGRPIVIGRPIVSGPPLTGTTYGNGRYFASTFNSRYRPNYVYRPQYSVGFGVGVGYPYVYGGGYVPYGYPGYIPGSVPTYGYSGYTTSVPSYEPPPPAPEPVDEVPSGPGGLTFNVSPEHAFVYVDGVYVGTVGNFSPANSPFVVAPGQHRVEIQSPGFRTQTFDVNVDPGEIVPFEGSLEQTQP